MQRRINPFNELYVTESISSSQFVRIFSPALIHNAEPLFLPGNVIVSGVQGSGKSMLLELQKTEVRIAYSQLGVPYPVDSFASKFISAGINLIHSRAIDFGQRPLADDPEIEQSVAPLFFADFVNHWLVRDVLSSLDKLTSEAGQSTAQGLGLSLTQQNRDAFAVSLASSDVWMGTLSDVSDWNSLKNALSARIASYFSFLNFNTERLPDHFGNTKTRIGEPVSAASACLKSSGLMPEDVHLFLQIDQYEELCRLEGLYATFGPLYRRTINKALGLRSSTVSYRIGTRGYALADDLTILGTTAKLEVDRNYKLIDLDVLLRRPENPRSWIFPRFAEDVFQKRLTLAGYRASDKSLIDCMGKGFSAPDKARRLVGSNATSAVKVDSAWPAVVRQSLQNLASDDPLAGRLSEAWVRQNLDVDDRISANFDVLGWQSKTWWKKERIEQALMQIAGRGRAQRMLWSGKDDVLQLSGGNILVFVSICQHIWGAWLRSMPELDDPTLVPSIENDIQALGVHEASTHWFNKLPEERDGNTRQRFVSYVANLLERRLFRDLAMSNPGQNGFSVIEDELKMDPETKRFLEDAVDYGALFDAPHTTKSSDRRHRIKVYLNPILCPHFRLPHIRTKEPYYVRVSDLRRWMTEAAARTDSSLLPEGLQHELFSDEEL